MNASSASAPSTDTPPGASTSEPRRGEANESSALVKWTIIMAVATVALALISLWAIFQTRHDARELLGVQISNALDEQFDSSAMRRSRVKFAGKLRIHQEASDFRVLDFFDKVGMYVRRGIVDREVTYSEFSYWVERYWLATRDQGKHSVIRVVPIRS